MASSISPECQRSHTSSARTSLASRASIYNLERFKGRTCYEGNIERRSFTANNDNRFGAETARKWCRILGSTCQTSHCSYATRHDFVGIPPIVNRPMVQEDFRDIACAHLDCRCKSGNEHDIACHLVVSAKLGNSCRKCRSGTTPLLRHFRVFSAFGIKGLKCRFSKV